MTNDWKMLKYYCSFSYNRQQKEVEGDMLPSIQGQQMNSNN